MIIKNKDLIGKLDKEYQELFFKMTYYIVFMEWLNDNKM